MDVRNRTLKEWFDLVDKGRLVLPSFQRDEAWGSRQVASLLRSVLLGLPAGAALTLQIGESRFFETRPIVGAPEPSERVIEYLLDGQQRLTGLWRALHDKYDDRKYLVGAETDEDGKQTIIVRALPKGKKSPKWIDDPKGCWERGLIPLSLCSPDSKEEQRTKWVDDATGNDDSKARIVERQITEYKNKIAEFRIPCLELPSSTPKETALDVFINMNTSSVRLSPYDIIAAQYEAANEEALRDRVHKLKDAIPRLKCYRKPEDLLLDIAALRQNRAPNQASYPHLDLRKLSKDFDKLIAAASFAVEALEVEGIFDSARLPTVAVLPVLGALKEILPNKPDELGNAIALIRAYLWRAFTTSRYERAAATRALQDFRGLRDDIERLGDAPRGGTNTAPIFDEELCPLPKPEELVKASWPKQRRTLPRAILCAGLRRGSLDLADGTKPTPDSMTTREYHHLFPEAYLKQTGGLGRGEIYRALNCSLITGPTNRRIGAKPPLTYLRERVELASLGENVVRSRLESHLIPWDEFANSSEEDVAGSYQRFLEARSELVADYLTKLCHGEEPNP